MLTSGARMGTRPAASTCCPTSNCCLTTAAMPSRLARLMTERSFVPNTPSALARCSSVSRPGLGFISCTPFARSEEHTSELQSLMRISYAVFCLKKKKQQHEKSVSDNNSQNIIDVQVL